METLCIFSRQFDSSHSHGSLPDGWQTFSYPITEELLVICSESTLGSGSRCPESSLALTVGAPEGVSL